MLSSASCHRSHMKVPSSVMPSLLRRHHTAWRSENKCIGLLVRGMCAGSNVLSFYLKVISGDTLYMKKVQNNNYWSSWWPWHPEEEQRLKVEDSFLDWLTTLEATTTPTSLVIIYIFVEVVRYSGSPLISISCKLLLRDFSSSLAIAVIIKTVALRMDQEARLTVRDIVDKGYNLSFSVVRERRKITKHKKT